MISLQSKSVLEVGTILLTLLSRKSLLSPQSQSITKESSVLQDNKSPSKKQESSNLKYLLSSDPTPNYRSYSNRQKNNNQRFIC